MKRMFKRLALAGVTTLLCLNVGQALAQQGVIIFPDISNQE